jgi:glucan 1,3-beta-glucosidase
LLARRRITPAPDRSALARVAVIAFAGGSTIGWAVANVPIESLTLGDWIRSLGWTAVALAAPVAAAAAVVQGRGLPTLERMLARSPRRPRDPLTLALGVVVIALVVLAVQAALGLVFNPRYRDFPFAPLTAAAVPLMFVVTWEPKLRAARPAAETAIAVTLIVSAVYIVFNESFANWQSLWFCAGVLAFAFTLLQVRAAPG